ncbi:MAG: molybdopterin-dependent oxidoreductase [Blastocatellales bacterium]
MSLITLRLALGSLLTLTLLTPVPTAQTTPQEAKASEVRLRVGGEVGKQLDLSAEDLAKLPRRKARAKDHGGTEAEFEGVAMTEILKLAGAPAGEQLRGDKLVLFLLVEAADNYRAVFALPELDALYTDKLVLLADRRDGKPLSEKEGPLRIIVPDEKRHARWVRQVIALTVKRAQ